jgi:NADH-quinone oxidoreductase subunit J
MTLVTVVFWVFSGIAVFAAVLCISRRSAVASALWLVVTLFSLAGIFVLLEAQFIAVLQVLVYAGAIMVLFLFVIMLLNLGRAGPSDLKGPIGLAAATILAGVLMLQLRPLGNAEPPAAMALPEGALSALQQQQGMVGMVARPLFETYLIPFEITSLLLLAAVVGAVVLAKRKL